jgi:glucokinase
MFDIAPTLPGSAGGTSLARRLNERLVLESIFEHGPMSRVAVARLTGLSKPTVSSIVDGLVDAGLVQQQGRTSGGIGRTAALYEVDGRVGNVVAIDLGGTKITGALADLYGNVRAERTEATNTESTKALIDQLSDLAHLLAHESGVRWSAVRAIAVGVPGTVDPETGGINLAYNIPDLSKLSLADELRRLGKNLVVVVENDVNAAAVGERWQGWANDCDNFAFIAIGTGIGAGLVVNGQLCRGMGGAAGEIGYLPFGDDPFAPDVDCRGPLEAAAAGRGVIAALERRLTGGASSTLTVGSTVSDIFDAAIRGDNLAREIFERETRLIAMTIAAMAAVVAPDLVVLGGGVGSNAILLEPVRRHAHSLIAQPLRIEQSALGERAALVGALALGLAAARTVVLTPPSDVGPFLDLAGE